MKRKVAENRMIGAVPVVQPHHTIADVERILVARAKGFETINYIYVTDGEGRLVGVISVKETFRAPKNSLVQELMSRKLITAHPGTHQETIANLALKYNLKAIPVVDKNNRFIGVVPSDTILQILHEEHGEDVLRSAGIIMPGDRTKDIVSIPAVAYFAKRIPWLIVGLGGGIAAAFMVGIFEGSLKEILTLAAFIPAIVYMADAVGGQTQTIFIRSLAVNRSLEIKKWL